MRMKKVFMIGVLFVGAVMMAHSGAALAGGKGMGPGPGYGGQGSGGSGMNCPGCMGDIDCDCGMGMGPKMKGMGEVFMMKIGKFVDELVLAADQKTKIAELRAAFKEKVAPLREKNQGLRQEIIAELKKTKYDRKKVVAKHEEMKKVKSEMMDLHFDLVLDIYDTLTDKQKDALWKKIDAAKEKTAGKPGKGPGKAK